MGAERLVWLFALGCAPTIGDTKSTTGGGAEVETDGRDSADPDSGTTDPDPDPEPSGPCGITVPLDTPFFTEGDLIELTVVCADGPVADAGLSLAGAGPAASFDAATGQLRWPTDGASGGRWDLTVAAGGGSYLESAVVTLWIADAPDAPDASAPRAGTYTEEWGLPVVHVSTSGTITEEERAATISVRDSTVEGQVKIRGASSASYPKVSYTLDFDSDELGVAEWGERTREHMVLITSFDDNSYVRQRLGYDLWAAMAEHQGVDRLSPRTFFAVLYVNGEYQGLYTACDRIDDEFLRHMGTTGEGSLYKAISHDANFYLTDAGGRTKSWLGAGYEKKEGDPDDWQDLYDLVELTGSADDDTLWSTPSTIDFAAFADWMLWAQLTLAQDSAGKNAYLYWEDGADAWSLMPWDLNESFGQNWYTLRLSSTRRNDYHWNNRVFRMLQEHPEAREMVLARYHDLREDGPFQPAVLQSMIDGYVETLGPNIDRDWARWGDDYQRYSRWSRDRDSAGDWTTPAEELTYVRTWIEERLAWYDAEGPL